MKMTGDVTVMSCKIVRNFLCKGMELIHCNQLRCSKSLISKSL